VSTKSVGYPVAGGKDAMSSWAADPMPGTVDWSAATTQAQNDAGSLSAESSDSYATSWSLPEIASRTAEERRLAEARLDWIAFGAVEDIEVRYTVSIRGRRTAIPQLGSPRAAGAFGPGFDHACRLLMKPANGHRRRPRFVWAAFG
jgi:hypothetical protein